MVRAVAVAAGALLIVRSIARLFGLHVLSDPMWNIAGNPAEALVVIIQALLVLVCVLGFVAPRWAKVVGWLGLATSLIGLIPHPWPTLLYWLAPPGPSLILLGAWAFGTARRQTGDVRAIGGAVGVMGIVLGVIAIALSQVLFLLIVLPLVFAPIFAVVSLPLWPLGLGAWLVATGVRPRAAPGRLVRPRPAP